jgi:hypothetical protein
MPAPLGHGAASLPDPPDQPAPDHHAPVDLDGVALWRVWHPTVQTPAATTLHTYGPLQRFDPHPPPTRDHGPRGPYAWYGAFLFDTAVCERLARGEGVVDICPALRATLVATAPATAVHDLTDAAVCAALGAGPALGDDPGDDVYALTQRWARHLHRTPDARGLRYWSARHRGTDGRRHGVNVVLWRKRALRQPVHQHRLIDDVLWPHALIALDRAGVAANRIPTCPRC